MHLYGYWRSSASWRVRIGLALKGVEPTPIPVDLRAGDQHGSEHQSRSPLGQVPVLHWTDDGEMRDLTQSLAILRWLDRTYPDPPLVPSDPWLEAWTWQLAEMINSGIQPLQNLTVQRRVGELTGTDGSTWCREFIASGLTAIEALVARSPATHLSCEFPTLADCCLVPQLYNARRFGVDLSLYPHLLRVERACAVLPAFLAAHPDRQPDAAPTPTPN